MARRFYDLLPRYLRTPHNNRSAAITEDILYDPEDFGPIEGHIGTTDDLSVEELARNPRITERDAERDAYQLSVGVATGDRADVVDSGAFYMDVIGHVMANGGNVSDHSRLFDTQWSAWTPPIDADRWVNPQRYAWTGEGDARLNGEYITRDPAGSRTVLHRVDSSTTITRVVVQLSSVAVGSFSAGSTIGDLREDCVDPERKVYRWSGSSWSAVSWVLSEDVPTESDLPIGSYYYVARSNHQAQRPLFYRYSASIGRWVPLLPVISPSRPEDPSIGALWEDPRSSPARKVYEYTASGWTQITWTATANMVGVGTAAAGTYRYHALDVSSVTDGWSANNWWKHYDDLSPADHASLGEHSLGMRPILQLWGSIEKYGSSNRSSRHSLPRFNVYAYHAGGAEIRLISVGNFGQNTVDASQGSTLLQYSVGAGATDPILGFPGDFNESGEFKFDTTLVTDAVALTDGTPIRGYRYFKDAHTGLIRTIWTKMDTDLEQVQDGDGVWELPRSLVDNPDHETPGVFSRSDVLHHYISLFTENSDGEPVGSNGYRWTDGSPVGSKIIDPESPMLKTMSLLLSEDLDLPGAIRTMSQEYARFCRRFSKRLDDAWATGEHSDPDDTFKSGVTAAEVCDAVLTWMLAGKTEDGPFWNSSMGTYVSSDTGETRPISVPPSPARVGAVMPTLPTAFTLLGVDYLRSHDGRVVRAWGDDRDLVWLELETRFYSAVPATRRTVPSTGTFGKHQWLLRSFVGNREFLADASVRRIADDASSEPDPGEDGYRVFSREHGSYAIWTNAGWAFSPADIDDVFLNEQDSKKYAFNGASAVEIKQYQRPHTFDYAITEAAEVVRREFNRWAISRGIDPAVNSTYDAGDRFTWNYSAAGVEGNYRGIYRRIYGTDAPHMRPWEIYGFSIEPGWWRSVYIPTSTAPDGSPRYGSAHAMWTNLRAGGTLMPLSIEQWQKPNSSFPIPVDANGELIDPITAGIVSLDGVPESRRGDRWKYGDVSPAEAEFLESPEGRYAEALLGYLLKPSRFVEALWSDYSIAIGEGQLFRGAIVVDVDDLTRRRIGSVPVHGELDEDSGEFYSNPGLVSWIGERLIMVGSDPKTSFGDIVRNSRAQIGWRCGGFISGGRTEFRLQNGIKIPDSDFSVIVHRSLPKSIMFHGGVMVVRDGTGYRVYGYDTSDPYFSVIPGIRPVIGGQVFMREDFTATAGQTEFVTQTISFGSNETTDTAVLVDGYKIDQRHIEIEPPATVRLVGYLGLEAGQIVTVVQSAVQTSASTRTRTFMVDGRAFFYYPVSSETTVRYEYGHRFESNQDIVEFLYDHGRWMESMGWRYGADEDPEVARNDWLAVASRFAQWSVNGPDDGEVFADVAGGKKLKLTVEHGHMLDVESVSDGSYSVIDMGGFPIKPAETIASRVGGDMVIECPGKEIFGLRVRICEIEHAVFFSNATRFDDVVYVPMLGLRRTRLLTKTYRSLSWNGRMEAPGFIINGGQLLPNFEKQAFDFTRFYDTVNPIDDMRKLEQAWNLYGWRRRGYIEDVGVTLPASFDFHRGLTKYKGTQDAFVAFARGMVARTDGTKLTENWAWKSAEFGAIGDRTRCRFMIGEQEVRDKIQIVTFTDEPNETDSIIEVLPFNRSTGDGDDRWIVPPSVDGITNMSFPLSSGGAPDPARWIFKLSAVAIDPTRPGAQDPIRFFHWDPAAGLHSPYAQSQVDITSPADPARYNQGPQKNRAPGFEWGAAQVGRIWWDTSRLGYHGYRTDSTLRKRADEWGKPERLKVVSQVINEFDITITTETAHAQALDDGIVLYSSDGRRYEATVTEVVDADSLNVVAKLGGDPDPVFLDPDNIPTFKELRKKDVEVYEWVASQDPPSAWPDSLGSVKDADDPSYVETVDGTTTYYFWVRHKPTPVPGKSMSVEMIESELRDPTSAGRNWFSPISGTSFAFNAGGMEVGDNTALELTIDSAPTNTHVEWSLLREGHELERAPEHIIDKLIDSLLGVDKIGGHVPRPLLAEEEKYGTGRGQTVFRDRVAARAIFKEKMSNVLCATNKQGEPSFYAVFPEADLGTWFTQRDYIEPEMAGISVHVTVKDMAELGAIGIRMEGDIVRVVSATTDPYDSMVQVSQLFRYESGEWAVFGAVGYGIQIEDAIFTIPSAREKIKEILAFMTPREESEVLISLIREMLKQSLNCDWCFKTSLYDLMHTIYASQPEFLPIDEIPTLLDAVAEIKPFHSKLRDLSIIVRNQTDAFSVTVKDDHVFPIAQYNDRLSTNGLQDFGWDARGWDIGGWDLQPWHMTDLGRGSWETIGTFEIEPGTRVYSVPGPARQGGPQVRVAAYRDGIEVAPPGNTVLINVDGSVTVTFPDIPPIDDRQYRVQQALGTRYGSDPTLPASITDAYPWLEPAPSGQEHAAIRVRERVADLTRAVTGDSDAFGDPEDMTGGLPGERVKIDSEDSLIIAVTTEHTPAYAGWDAAPWDYAPWDYASTAALPTTEFMQTVGPGTTFSTVPYTETLLTGEAFTMDATYESRRMVSASNQRYHVTGVLCDYTGPFTEIDPTDYVIDKDTVTFFEIPDQQYYSSGLTATFDRPIKSIRYQSSLLTLGVDYTLSADLKTATLSGQALSVRPLTVGFMNPTDDGNQVILKYGRVDLLSLDARITAVSSPDIEFLIEPLTGTMLVTVDPYDETYDVEYPYGAVTGWQTSAMVAGGAIEYDAYFAGTLSAYPTAGLFAGFRLIGQGTDINEWNGTAWSVVGSVVNDRTYFVRRGAQAWKYTGTWTMVSDADAPNLQPFYSYGRPGIAGGSLFYGRHTSALATFTEAGYVVNGPLPNLPVSTWVGAGMGRIEDVSGKVRRLFNVGADGDFVQETSGNRPGYNQGGVSGWDRTARITFTAASSHRMTSAGGDDVWAGGGHLAVVVSVDTGAARTIVGKRGGSDNAGWSLRVLSGGAIVFTKDFSGSQARWTTTETLSNNTYALVQVTYDSSATGNDPTVWIDGVQATLTENVAPSGTSTSDASNDLYLGSKQDGTEALEGALRELIILSDAPSAAERRELTSILRDRWF